MKTIKIITLLCFLSIGVSQSANRHSLFLKAQNIPTVGADFSISNRLSVRPSIMVNISDGTSSFVGEFAILHLIGSNINILKYIGSNFIYDRLYDGIFIGVLIGIRTSINNKISVFGEVSLDAGLRGDGISDFGLLHSGVGINYYFDN